MGGASPVYNATETLLEFLSLSATDRVRLRLRRNAVLTAPVWQDHSTGFSAIEYDQSLSGFANGEVIAQWVGSGNIFIKLDTLDFLRPLLLEYPSQSPRSLTLTAQKTSNGTTDGDSAITWLEIK